MKIKFLFAIIAISAPMLASDFSYVPRDSQFGTEMHMVRQKASKLNASDEADRILSKFKVGIQRIKSIGKKPKFGQWIECAQYFDDVKLNFPMLAIVGVQKIAEQERVSDSELVFRERQVKNFFKIIEKQFGRAVADSLNRYKKDLSLGEMKNFMLEYSLNVQHEISYLVLKSVDKLKKLHLNEEILEKFKQDLINALREYKLSELDESSQELALVKAPLKELYSRIKDTPEFKAIEDLPYKKYCKLLKDDSQSRCC